ncbi:MAG TPA: VCBS repeat-containing protein, partial [Verrucomicrobiae bacterium]|nr:VCBS repeat-containing protein [Verrucomicrobiae bacterium]
MIARGVIAFKQLARILLLGTALALEAGTALQWQSIGVHRFATVVLPTSGKTGFSLVPAALSGVDFTNQLAESRSLTNQIYLNGSGVAAGDVDGDGWCDLYLCGLDNSNRLYRNLGDWKFQDITAEAGVACDGLACSGAAFADLDGDGDLDLVVNSVGGGTQIFFNDGKGHFTRVAVLNSNHGAMSLALADIDGDGDLDLYIANYRTTTVRDQPNTRIEGDTIDGQMLVRKVNGRPATEPDLADRFTLDPGGKILEHGEVDALYRNDGAGRFTPISFTDGTFLDEDAKPLHQPPHDWGLSVMFRDVNGDGWPDIYVCNDFHSPDRLWLNDGHGHFQAAPRLALRHTSMFSMGIDFADVNRDGLDDFFVADMLSRSHARRQTQVGNFNPLVLPIGHIYDRPQYSFNNLQLNRGDGTYAEIAQFSGVDASDWSWTPIFLDVDLDGYEDLLITTGHERDALHMDIINRVEAAKSRQKLDTMDILKLQKLFPRLA